MTKKDTEHYSKKIENNRDYKAYIPPKINHDFIFKDNRTLKLLEEASHALGRLNELSKCIPFVNSFTNMHLNIEALGSGEIEGTKTDIKELVEYSSKKDIAKDDLQNTKEIWNLCSTTYKLMNDKIKYRQKYSIKSLERINKELFRGIVPGNEYFGKVRNSQNYIGGTSIMDALFIPPTPGELLALLTDLNDFWYNQDYYLPDLIKIGIYHFQYETIHPFVDGNGRMGRLLINLQLQDTGLLDLPILCLSNYWKRFKGLYYDGLSNSRFSGDIEHWVRFFLSSIKEASIERILTIQKINDLANKYNLEINESYKNPKNHIKLLEYLLEKCPIITVKEIQEELQLTYQGANKIIQNFVDMQILKETSSNKRNRIFMFEEYHDLVFNIVAKN